MTNWLWSIHSFFLKPDGVPGGCPSGLQGAAPVPFMGIRTSGSCRGRRIRRRRKQCATCRTLSNENLWRPLLAIRDFLSRSLHLFPVRLTGCGLDVIAAACPSGSVIRPVGYGTCQPSAQYFLIMRLTSPPIRSSRSFALSAPVTYWRRYSPSIAQARSCSG